MNSEIFESSVRHAGDLAGVFEYDGEVGYFYLYDNRKGPREKILSSIFIISGETSFSQDDVVVSWNSEGTYVGLYILNRLWAVFSDTANKYGGAYKEQADPAIPKEVLAQIKSSIH